MVRGDERQQHRRMPGWVPALALMLSLGCDPPGPPTPAGGDRSTVTPLFVELTDEVGLTFVHEPGAGGRYLMPEPIGAGAVLFDFDQDGDLDIYLVNSGFLDQRGVAVVDPPHGGDRPVNRLFEQDDDGRFVDVTAASGLGHDGYGMGAAAGDVNNDGFPDLYVTNYGSDRLFLNAGDGSFRDITSESGIDNLLWGTSVSFLDFDRDGWLDVFVTNYVDYLPSTRCTDNRGRDDYCGPQLFAGMPDKLYRNTTGDRAGTVRPSAVRFVDVSLTAGIARQGGPGLGVVCADFNDDRWPDIYVANDHAANFLWINRTDGTFAEEAIFRGGALSAQGRPQASMGVGLGDVDANGRLDLFLTHLEGETNALYLGLDDQGFSEAAGRCGLGQPSYPFTGFGTALVDIDHDGDLDVLVANGRVKRTTRPWGGPAANAVPHRSLPASWKNYAEPNLVFLNDGRARFTHYHHRRPRQALPQRRPQDRALVDRAGGRTRIRRAGCLRGGGRGARRRPAVHPRDPARQQLPFLVRPASSLRIGNRRPR